ncbi:MAG: ATP-binding protein [Polyangiaceae bacterium]
MVDDSPLVARDADHPRDPVAATADRFQRLVEQAPDGIVISRQGLVLYANAAALHLLGYERPDELVGQPMAVFLDGAALATMRERLQHMRETGHRLPPHEYPAKRRDGSPMTAEITSIFIDYDGGPAVLAFARDVTDRARTRAQLEQAERLAALGRMAAGVAHEVNNPLAYMLLTVEALTRQLAAARVDAGLLDLCADLRHGVDRIATIARDLRVYARHEDELYGSVDLAIVLQQSVRLAAHELRPRIELTVEHGALPEVSGVPTRLEQVFVNLLLNAGHAIADERSDGKVAVRARVGAREVIVEVEDNGAGIPAENIDRAFDPFFTTRAAHMGMGLGLGICRDIVARLGGSISVASEVGHATTMTVTLPIAAPVDSSLVARGAPAAQRATPAPVRRRILVIDDEPLIASIVSATLGEVHDVVVVTRAADGLARVLDDGAFDLVLCDLMMPGMSGMDLYDEVARRRPGMERRFAFLTGGAYTARSQGFLERIANARLMKPFSSQALVELVDAAATLR